MATQPHVAQAGQVTSVLGSADSLAVAAPLANGDISATALIHADRIGWFWGRDAGFEKIGAVVMGATVAEFYANPDKPSLELSGVIKIGDYTGSTPSGGMIRWTGSAFEGHDGTSWKNLLYETVVSPVESLSQLPAPVGNVITLEPDTAYLFRGTVDLLGNRLVGSANTTILGLSSEVSAITSTGLGAGVPLLTTGYTTPIKNITFKDVDTALLIDGNSVAPAQLPALDWTGVNFVNIPNIGIIKNIDNFIYTDGAFLNSQNLLVDGNVSTFAINQSILSGTGSAGSIVSVAATAVINRRFRIIYSSVIVTGSTVGISFNESATVPNDNYILDTVNFSGGGVYVSGVPYTSNKARFLGVRGVPNSGEVINYYMSFNAVATVIDSPSTYVKVAGTTLLNPLTQKFAHTDNRATYSGSLTRLFQVSATISLNSGNNLDIGLAVFKNDNIVTPSITVVTTSGTGKVQSVTVQAIVELATNDNVEVWAANYTSATNITVENLNVIVKSISD